VSLEVWDTGLGIPASKQRIVFREFQRLDQGAKVARGLGLGLSIVQRIARVLDHPIALTSKPGHGSVFSIELPIVAALPVSAAPDERPRIPAAPLAGLRVLAVDNEPTILEGMRTLMNGWGCRVTTASDLRSALDAIRTTRGTPDVVIADFHLDEGDGLDVIRSLRWQMRSDLPAILITADRSPTVRDDAAAMNVHLLNKPVKPAALRALLAQWRASRVAAE
jgi:CheY-like chemotaxis protein